MKKLLWIVVLGLLWCNVGNAGINEPGTDQKCFDLFEKNKVFKKEFLPAVNKDTHIFIVYTKLAKKRGLNVELHIVKGGHDDRKTFITYGKDIIKEVLK